MNWVQLLWNGMPAGKFDDVGVYVRFWFLGETCTCTWTCGGSLGVPLLWGMLRWRDYTNCYILLDNNGLTSSWTSSGMSIRAKWTAEWQTKSSSKSKGKPWKKNCNPWKKLDARYPKSPRQRYFDAFISQSTDTFYTRQLLHQATFTTSTLVTKHLLYRTLLTSDTFYTRQFLQQTTFTPGTIYNVYTRHFLHQTPFTTHNFDTRHLLHQTIFTTNNFYTKQHLQRLH